MQSRQANYTQKLAKVISLSNNYKHHYDNLAHIKPAINFNDHKHMKKVSKLSQEKYTYGQNVKKLKLNSLSLQNQSFIKRLGEVHSHVKKGIQAGGSRNVTPRRYEQPRTIAHDLSSKSLLSNISEKTVGSNWRRRTIRQKQIQGENRKIAQRIMHPKMSKDVSRKNFHKFFQKEQSYSRIRSRFSERSTGIMQSLALGGLKMEKKNCQFLPQLSFKRLDRSVNQTLTVRAKASGPSRINSTIANPQKK